MCFRVTFRGRRIEVDMSGRRATYTLRDGTSLELSHHGDAVTLEPGQPLELQIPSLRPGQRPSQPRGRAPATRRPAR
jgi:alpha,alpha-trehalose phosphorylase